MSIPAQVGVPFATAVTTTSLAGRVGALQRDGCRAEDVTHPGQLEGPDMTAHRRAAARSLGIAFAVAALLTATIIAPATAGGRGTTNLRGTQLAAGTCDDGGYAMTGSLVGCWWIDTFDPKYSPDQSPSRATGEEHFEGCLGAVCGTFTTRYQFTAKTDGPWPTSAELHGRCHHPVTGGTEGFAGASGEISFHDVVDVSPPFYPYWGNVHLARGTSGATTGATTAARTLARSVATAGATATTC